MSNQTYETIRVEDDDNLAVLTIARPDKLNALNEQVLADLSAYLSDMPEATRGLIITGEGDKAFIAGADIAAMNAMSDTEINHFIQQGQTLTLQIENLPIPVIAAVNGYAFGGGCEIALASDFIYASENAIFSLPEVSLGLIPGFGGTQRLPRIVGRNRAKQLIYSAAKLDVNTAQAYGLVLAAYADKTALLNAAKASLLKIVKHSSSAVAATKKAINSGVDDAMTAALNSEKDCFIEAFKHVDAKEGTGAFLEKRKPEFA